MRIGLGFRVFVTDGGKGGYGEVG